MKFGNMFISTLVLLFTLFSSGSVFSKEKAENKDWEVMVEPYILFTSINGDAKVGRTSGVDVGVDFDDILDVLEFGFMGHGEIFYKDSWGLILDYGYMSVGDDISLPLGGIIDAKAEQSVFETFLAKRFVKESVKFDILVGVRAWDNEIDIT